MQRRIRRTIAPHEEDSPARWSLALPPLEERNAADSCAGDAAADQTVVGEEKRVEINFGDR